MTKFNPQASTLRSASDNVRCDRLHTHFSLILVSLCFPSFFSEISVSSFLIWRLLVLANSFSYSVLSYTSIVFSMSLSKGNCCLKTSLFLIYLHIDAVALVCCSGRHLYTISIISSKLDMDKWHYG